MSNYKLYHDNMKQLGEAVDKAGGVSWFVLDEHRDLLETLAHNNIVLAAKYIGETLYEQNLKNTKTSS